VTIEPGIALEVEFEAAGWLLTDLDGRLPIPVLSTPAMIAMMERAATLLVLPALPDGKVSVGFEVCVKHVASAFETARCTVRARLDDVEEQRKLRFSVEVVDADGRTIGVGTHERRVIDPGR
jgi:predicted thioesterase